jgi:hypothetical protein
VGGARPLHPTPPSRTVRLEGTLIVALAAMACGGGRGAGPVGYSPPRAAGTGGRGLDGGAASEPSPLPADFRARMTRVGDRFVSKGHGHRFQAVLWVNDVARGAWADLPGEMPEGALLAEEVSDQDARGERPRGLLAMEKTARGWRFVAIGPDGEVAPDARGAACAACHRDAPHDGVFVEVTPEAR